jgi:hypothetical protein
LRRHVINLLCPFPTVKLSHFVSLLIVFVLDEFLRLITVVTQRRMRGCIYE